MNLKAVYNVTVPSLAGEQPTLVYNLKDGFTWLKTEVDNDWSCYATTAAEAETLARQAGYDPLAIVYVDIARPS
jgi:hypothetical protein